MRGFYFFLRIFLAKNHKLVSSKKNLEETFSLFSFAFEKLQKSFALKIFLKLSTFSKIFQTFHFFSRESIEFSCFLLVEAKMKCG